jgi:phosphoribosylanthranilate isomerase
MGLSFKFHFSRQIRFPTGQTCLPRKMKFERQTHVPEREAIVLFSIKICGVTNVRDAALVAQAGADAMGLNFYPPSPRYVDPARASTLLAALPEGVTRVGVFVNAAVDDVLGIARELELDAVQLHGDESPEYLARVRSLLVVRAFRCPDAALGPVAQYLDRCDQLHRLPDAVLLDAYHPGQYGGTGITLDWQRLARSKDELLGLPLILAGGLDADNVVEAIETVRPDAVDTASGVEASAGQKDPLRLRTFVAAARGALGSRWT